MSDPMTIADELASYREWANENPTCCEYCLDQWLSNQDKVERAAK